jgi:hypothetical protein
VSPITAPAKLDTRVDATRTFDTIQGTISTKNAYSSLWTINCPSTRSAYRQQIISEFIYIFTPKNLVQQTPSPTAHADNFKSWFTLLPTHPDFTTALEATVLAICTAKLGRVNKDSALVHESLKFYIQGLWELQKALYSPELMYKEETAASCVAYEVMECPDQTVAAWIKHTHGCSKLFELRGPKAYSSEFGHELFLAFRQLEARLIPSPACPTHNTQLLTRSRFNKRLLRNGKPSSQIRNGIFILGKAIPSLSLTNSSICKLS